jgi:putative DNA methylase
VLIQKAMLEIPPRFAGRPPVHPDIDNGPDDVGPRPGSRGRCRGVRQVDARRGQRGSDTCTPTRLGPDGEKLTPIAWIWARTVESPDPTWKVTSLSWRRGRSKRRPASRRCGLSPVIDRDTQTISYEVRELGASRRERTVDVGAEPASPQARRSRVTTSRQRAELGEWGNSSSRSSQRATEVGCTARLQTSMPPRRL